MVKVLTSNVSDKFGRYLAGENILIVTGNYRTAFIDMEDRAIYMPVWNTHSEYVADMLRSHEVGHALFTPPQGWHDAIVQKNSKAFAGYLNVIEDSRIERKMQQRFNLTEIFVEGYRQLVYDVKIFDSAAYGKISEIKDFSRFNLIDRINLEEKIGKLVSIPFFNEEEKMLLLRTQTTQTWEDVVQVANDVFEYDKKNQKNQSQTNAGSPEYDPSNSSKGSGKEGDRATVTESEDGNGNDASESADKDEGNASNNDQKPGNKSGSDASNNTSDDPISETDNALRYNESRLVSSSPQRRLVLAYKDSDVILEL